MDTRSGYIEKIIYRNEENNYTVLEITEDGESLTLTGVMQNVSAGEYIEAAGTLVDHPLYGTQLQVDSYELKAPEDKAAILKYLSSGAIKGVGEALAARIVKKFGKDTMRILEDEPERLAEVKGISERMAMNISSQVAEKRTASPSPTTSGRMNGVCAQTGVMARLRTCGSSSGPPADRL